MVLRAKEETLLNDLLPFFILSDKFYEAACAISVGSLSKTINWKDLAKQEFVLPSIEKQKDCRSFVEAEKSIENANERVEKAVELKFGLVNKLMKKGMNHKDFELSIFGQKPSKWKIQMLDNVCTKIQDGTHFSPKIIDKGRPYITSKNIKPNGLNVENIGYISEEAHRDIFKRCDPVKGDILYVKDGANTGNLAINDLDYEFSLLSV